MVRSPKMLGVWHGTAAQKLRSILLAATNGSKVRDGAYAQLPLNARSPPTLAAASEWTGVRLLLDGRHAGCIERRAARHLTQNQLGVCEFDGRLALARLRGELLLYARANMASHGQRFVQVTRSRDEGASWSPFVAVELRGSYESASRDIYFLNVVPYWGPWMRAIELWALPLAIQL